MYTQKDNKKVNILGTDYSIIFAPADTGALEKADGITDESVKKIIVGIFEPTATSVEDLGVYQKKILRHEIVHAFLFESGLAECSGATDAWAHNETMIDWIARQHSKLHVVFEKAGAL